MLLVGTDITSHISVDKSYSKYFKVRDIESFSVGYLRMCVCSLMNAGKGGALYLGVEHTGVVMGINITRKQVNIFL